MSIRLMTMVWDIRWPTQNHLLVMLKLADHANDEGGKVWPAVSTIAAQAQCSERTVQNVLKALRDSGLVTVMKAGGGSSPTIYELNVFLLRALADAKAKLEGSADVIHIPEQTGAMVAPPPVAPVQPGTGTGATEGGTGAKLLHPNHHLEPSIDSPLRASARSEVSKSDFGSEGAKPSKALPCFALQPADTSWPHWIAHLRDTGKPEIADEAEQLRRLRVSSRWPAPESVVFEPSGSAKHAQAVTKRMTGDAA